MGDIGAVGGPGAGALFYKVEINVRVERLERAHSLGAGAELGCERASHHGDALGPAVDKVLGDQASLGGGVGGDKVSAAVVFGIEIDRRDGRRARVGSEHGLRGHNQHAGHLRAGKIATEIGRALLVSGATGDEQVVAALGRLRRGSGGNLQVEAVIQAGKHQAKGVVAASGEHARALVGRISQPIDGLVDLFDGLGAHLFGMVEYVRDRAEGNACLACHVSDCHMRHGKLLLMRFNYRDRIVTPQSSLWRTRRASVWS